MKILTNGNNEYFGLVTDYKNLEVFRRAVAEESIYSDRIVIEKMIEMRPLTDDELLASGMSEIKDIKNISQDNVGFIGAYNGTVVLYSGERYWIPVGVPCETSQAFYFATQGTTTEKLLVEKVEAEQILDNTVKLEEPAIVTVGDNLFKEELAVPYVEGTGHFEFHNNDQTEDEIDEEE